jgi:trehalose 6-phosphate phosphatase
MNSTSDLPTSADGWAFFLDFDGTLIDIAPTPEAVVVPSDLPGALMRLAARAGGALALVSGRPMASLDRFLAPARLPSAGIHGAEMRLPDGSEESLTGVDLAAVQKRMAELVARHPELLVEEKSVSATIHFRAKPELGAEIEAAMRAVVADDPRLAVQPGKMMVEVHVAGADKGRALERFMARPPFAGRRPLAVGDDLTDEHMFQVATGMGGLAVRVGADDRETAATVHLDGTPSVRAWLSNLAGYPK